MTASIVHRVSGSALAIAGLAILTWWLLALAEGNEAYDRFTKLASSPIGLIALIGLTWSFFQHLLSGVRHLVMDSGANFELNANKRSAVLTFVGAIVLTAAMWFILLGARV